MMLAGANRSGESGVHAPPEPQPRREDLWRDRVSVRPVSEAHRLAVVSDAPGGRLVALLLFMGGPSAVVRRVTEMVVHALDCMARRALSHVGVEVFKPEPSLRNGYPSAAIKRKGLMVWVRATLDHRVPCSIATVAVSKGCQPVNAGPFNLKTSATLGVSATEVPGLNECLVATHATTAPHDAIARSLRSWLNGGETTEPNTAQITNVVDGHGLTAPTSHYATKIWRRACL